MRIYPPLLLQRIWVKNISKDFRTVEVRIFKSLLNMNYNKSIFGGTMSSASDPFYAVCLYQILKRKGINVRVWVKSAEIRFLKPAYSTLTFTITISSSDLRVIEQELDSIGKVSITFNADMFSTKGELCANISNYVYIRLV